MITELLIIFPLSYHVNDENYFIPIIWNIGWWLGTERINKNLTLISGCLNNNVHNYLSRLGGGGNCETYLKDILLKLMYVLNQSSADNGSLIRNNNIKCQKLLVQVSQCKTVHGS